jgi:hypothetical protein
MPEEELTPRELLDRVKACLARYDLWKWRERMKFHGPENAARLARTLAGLYPTGPQIVECLSRGDQRGAGEAALRRWTFPLTSEFTGPRSRPKPAGAGPVQRRVGRHPCTTSRPGVLHERGNLYKLDARTHSVETGHPLE